ncbi:MAG: DUF3572 family protein [Hyphomicrobiaceae bacterium]|jgi:hypothetical protein
MAPLTEREAAEIGDRALAFLAVEPARLVAFLQATGMAPSTLRAQSDAPATLAAVLRYLLEDESLLLVFATEAAIAPDRIAPAAALLARDAAAPR